MAGETITATEPQLTVGTVRIERIQQAALDWAEGVELVGTLHRDLGQALEKLHTVV